MIENMWEIIINYIIEKWPFLALLVVVIIVTGVIVWRFAQWYNRFEKVEGKVDDLPCEKHDDLYPRIVKTEEKVPNFNMKREYQSEEELQANTDVLLPLVDNMLECRQIALEAVNKKYGTSISVDKNSSWENKQQERDTEQETKEAEKEAIEEGNADE